MSVIGLVNVSFVKSHLNEPISNLQLYTSTLEKSGFKFFSCIQFRYFFLIRKNTHTYKLLLCNIFKQQQQKEAKQNFSVFLMLLHLF